jgi:hypothetical protein
MQSCKNCVTCKMLSDITVITGNEEWFASYDYVTMMSMMLIRDCCDSDHVVYMSSKYTYCHHSLVILYNASLVHDSNDIYLF